MDNVTLNINLSFQQLIDIVKQLSPSEKLELNHVIWEEQIDIPINHQKLVLDRVQKSKVDPSRMLDWDEVSKTL